MTAKTHPRGSISTGILCFGLLLGLTSFANGSSEPNKPANNTLLAMPDANQSKPQCVLCGHITDAKTGRPVTDAIVWSRGGPISDVLTDANGFYCFEKIQQNGNCRIAIDSNEYIGIYNYEAMPIVNFSKDKQIIKDFKLDKACMIELRVVDEANKPIEGAEIKTTSSADERDREIGTDMLRKRTDKDGFVLLGGFPPSKTGYLITAIHGNYIKTSRAKDGAIISQLQWDYAPGKLEVLLNDTNVAESGLIVLQKGVDVYGNIQYEDGVPASDLKIYAYPDWWNIGNSPENHAVDTNGNFTLRHITPGIYRLYAYILKEQGGSVGIPILQTRLPLPSDELLLLKFPEKSPKSLVSIRGRLTFTGEKSPRYVDIDVYSPNKRPHSIMWQNYKGDACDMNFMIDCLEPGKYRITATSSDMERKVIEDVNAPCEGLEITLEPAEKPILKGTVIDSQTNRPIKNFKARAKKIKILRGQNYSQPDKWTDVNDTEGNFNIEATGPGVYQIQIAAEGFAWTWSEDVNTDDNAPVIVKLLTGGCLKGKVINEKGQPINGAKVLPLSKAGGVNVVMPTHIRDPFVSEDGAVETVDGKFELKCLAAGTESIKVLHPDYAYSTVSDIEVKEGQMTEGIEVVLNKGATVEGYVFGNQGRPQPNVTLYFQDVYSSSEKSGRQAEVVTDKNGYYQAGGLPEKLLIVKRQRAGESMGVVSRVLVPAKGKVSRIDLGGQPNVTGRLIIDGKQIANRRVTLSSIGGASSDFFRCYAMTENDGAFAFGGIPGGKWTVYYDDTGKRNNQVKVAEFELTGQNVDLGVIPTGFSTVSISIESEQETLGWNITKVYLQDDNEPWSRPATEIDIPYDANEPYIAKNVLPGEHYLVLVRKDYSTLRYPIKVDESSSKINIHLPKCTAGIHGQLTGKYLGWQTVWTKDKSVVSNIRPDENGNYKLDNLPAGQYLLGGNMLVNDEALLEFELTEGEQKALDIDIPKTLPHQMGGLQVIVLDENGAMLTGAKVWLQSGVDIVEPIGDIGGFYFVTKPQKYTLYAKFTGYKELTQQVQIENLYLKPTKRPPEPVFVRLER